MNFQAENDGVGDILLRVRADDVLKIRLDIDAAEDVDIVIRLEDVFARLNAGRVIA